jgi:predicted nucleic acid-binding protein
LSSVIDTSLLLYLLNEATPAPDDPKTGKPVENCAGRVNKLIADLAKKREKLIVPTPALAETLVRAGSAAPEYLGILEAHRAVQLADFNGLAAVEASSMIADIFGSADKPSGGDARVKMKFDIMIAAIAKVNGATTVYSDDPDIARLGERYGFQVIGIAALPEPPAETPDLFMQRTPEADA